jgi:hypothetical protein
MKVPRTTHGFKLPPENQPLTVTIRGWSDAGFNRFAKDPTKAPPRVKAEYAYTDAAGTEIKIFDWFNLLIADGPRPSKLYTLLALLGVETQGDEEPELDETIGMQFRIVCQRYLDGQGRERSKVVKHMPLCRPAPQRASARQAAPEQVSYAD